MTRREWKHWYRLLRIARRESQKAEFDMLLYGQSAVFISDNGEVSHVPLSEWLS